MLGEAETQRERPPPVERARALGMESSGGSGGVERTREGGSFSADLGNPRIQAEEKRR